MHSNFLYIITFETPYTYIKTFTSNEKPAKIYQDHLDIYNNIKFVDNKVKSNFDINVHYFVNPNDELMKSILNQLPSKCNTTKGSLMQLSSHCLPGFYSYDKDIELLNKLLQNCKNIQHILKEIGIPQKEDKYHSTPQLKHYKPNQTLYDIPSNTNEYTEVSPHDDIAYGLPLSFDVSLLHKDKSNITIDISKKDLSFDNEKDEIKNEIEKTNDNQPISEEVTLENISVPIKKTEQHIKDVLGVPLMDANLYSKLEKFSFNTAKEYKNMMSERYIFPSDITATENISNDIITGMTEELLYNPNRKRQHTKNTSFYELPTQTGVENNLDNNVALVKYLSYNDQPYVLMTTNEIIKLKVSVNYFPEFKILNQYVTPNDDEYYSCMAIKINKYLKQKNNNVEKLKDEMHKILSSINLFLDMNEYDKFLMTELYQHKTASIDKILIAIKNFSKQFDKTHDHDDKEREFILVKDFLKQFGEYLTENNLELDENELNNHETTVCQYLVFHKQVEMGMTDDLQKTLFLKKNMVSVSADDIPVMNSFNGIKVPPRFGEDVHVKSNDCQLRTEPIIDKIPISPMNQSSQLWIQDTANIKLDIPDCAPEPLSKMPEIFKTVGQTLGGPSREIRGDYPEPLISVSPWYNHTIKPDI